MTEDEEYVQQAIKLVDRIKDELNELDELIQIYDKVEAAVMANPEIQTNNGLFFAFQTTHTDSKLIRLRRIMDNGSRTGSLYQLARFIAAKPQAFSRKWFDAIYAGTPVATFTDKWWPEYANANGEHVCPVKLMAKADALRLTARAVSDWVSQNVAHLDNNPTVPMPNWGEYFSALSEIRGFFTWMYNFLTGCSLEPRVTMAFDWEESLMIPWMPMTTRVKRIRENRAQRAKAAQADAESKPQPQTGPLLGGR